MKNACSATALSYAVSAPAVIVRVRASTDDGIPAGSLLGCLQPAVPVEAVQRHHPEVVRVRVVGRVLQQRHLGLLGQETTQLRGRDQPVHGAVAVTAAPGAGPARGGLED